MQRCNLHNGKYLQTSTQIIAQKMNFISYVEPHYKSTCMEAKQQGRIHSFCMMGIAM